MSASKIVIRVYGIWINEDHILLSDEHYEGEFFTKFPGGGLKPGESVIECLKREWKEELSVEIDILKHFYTTDFFQQSAFDENAQILSIYYLVQPRGEFRTNYPNEKLDKESIKEAGQTFRWVVATELNESEVTYPIDRKVAAMLRETIL